MRGAARSGSGEQRAFPGAVGAYLAAANGGWGVTLRLCLILAVWWGLPTAGAVRVAALLLAHSR